MLLKVVRICGKKSINPDEDTISLYIKNIIPAHKPKYITADKTTAQNDFFTPVFWLKKAAGFWDNAATIIDNINGNILKSKKRLIIITVSPITNR
jgi:hypothetical protein